ncbi:MAG: hypothetical protein ACI8Q2_000378 [Candidatus Omnitrophota bacterium]
MKYINQLLQQKQISGGIAYLLLGLLTVGVYGSSLGNGFTWDDYMVLVDNTFVHSLDNLPKVFSREYLTSPSQLPNIDTGKAGSGEGSYRPVATLIHFFEYYAWELNPFFYHCVNLLLHVFNVCLVYGLLYRLFKHSGIAFVTAALFAVHPAHSEAVLGISFREDLLAANFSLLMFYWFLDKPKRWLSLGAYFLALFSKEMTIMVLPLLFIYKYFFTKDRFSMSDAFKTFYGYALVSIFYLWIRFSVMAPHDDFQAFYPAATLWGNVLVNLKVLGMYFTWLFTGIGVRVTIADAAFAQVTFFSAYVVICLGVLLFVIRSITQSKEDRSLLVFACLWFGFILLPVLNIIPIYNPIASRYLYLPSIGFYLFIAVLGSRFLQLNSQKAYLFIYVVFLSVMTLARSYVWQDEVSLRKEFYREYPHNVEIYRSLSGAYMREKNNDQEVLWLLKGLNEFPHNDSLHLDLAVFHRKRGLYEEALKYTDRLLSLDPKHYHGLSERCVILGLWQKKDESMACFEEGMRLYPTSEHFKINYESSREYFGGKK